MPQNNLEIDQELHPGEFLQLNDLMAPMDDLAQPMEEEDDSNITISLNYPDSAASISSANGPLAPNF